MTTPPNTASSPPVRGGEDLDERLRAKGMLTVSEMMGKSPLDRWTVHSGMTDINFFGQWLDRKTEEYARMRAPYELGDKDQSDELYEWVLAHSGAFAAVRTNFKAAIATAPSPDPAGAGGDLVERRDENGFACEYDGSLGPDADDYTILWDNGARWLLVQRDGKITIGRSPAEGQQCFTTSWDELFSNRSGHLLASTAGRDGEDQTGASASPSGSHPSDRTPSGSAGFAAAIPSRGPAPIARRIIYFGQPGVVICDARCDKAWGIHKRPQAQFSDDPDDTAFLADAELGEAPADPGTYEGGCAKPIEPSERLNKWCVRECERSAMSRTGRGDEVVEARDFSKRLYNQPWKHAPALAGEAEGRDRQGSVHEHAARRATPQSSPEQPPSDPQELSFGPGCYDFASSVAAKVAALPWAWAETGDAQDDRYSDVQMIVDAELRSLANDRTLQDAGEVRHG